MYLAKAKTGYRFCKTVEEVKAISKKDIIELYSLNVVDYDSLVQDSNIRDCIYRYLKGKQYPKEDVLEYVSDALGVKRGDVSKVITAMKKDKIIYVNKSDDLFYGCIGIN